MNEEMRKLLEAIPESNCDLTIAERDVIIAVLRERDALAAALRKCKELLVELRDGEAMGEYGSDICDLVVWASRALGDKHD
jgi:hypothetical protein